jgi:hypothetical protein
MEKTVHTACAKIEPSLLNVLQGIGRGHRDIAWQSDKDVLHNCML